MTYKLESKGDPPYTMHGQPQAPQPASPPAAPAAAVVLASSPTTSAATSASSLCVNAGGGVGYSRLNWTVVEADPQCTEPWVELELFSYDGEQARQLGEACLHPREAAVGGQCLLQQASFLPLAATCLRLPGVAQGFPGNLTVTVTYKLTQDNELVIGGPTAMLYQPAADTLRLRCHAFPRAS